MKTKIEYCYTYSNKWQKSSHKTHMDITNLHGIELIKKIIDNPNGEYVFLYFQNGSNRLYRVTQTNSYSIEEAEKEFNIKIRM